MSQRFLSPTHGAEKQKSHDVLLMLIKLNQLVYRNIF